MSSAVISLMLVSYNTQAETYRAISSIVQSTKHLSREILVTDNGSSDGSVCMIKNEFPEVTLFRNKKNAYFAPAINRMLHVASGEYIALINSDLYINKDAIDSILRYMMDNPACGVASCRIDHGAPEQGGYGGTNYWMKPSLMTIARKLYPLKYIHDRKNKASLQSSNGANAIEVDVLSDAFVVLRRDVFTAVGGYTKGLKLYYTEDDVCVKIKNRDYKIVYMPGVCVKHDSGRSTQKSSIVKVSIIGIIDIFIYSYVHLGVISAIALLPLLMIHFLSSVAYAVKCYSRGT